MTASLAPPARLPASQCCTRRTRERGFTLLELMVAMAVFGLIGLGIFGVLVLGARSAASGERITEQARRYRVANEVLSRQIASAEPIRLPSQDDEGLGEDEDAKGSRESKAYFFGEADTLEFVSSAPQRPDASGMAIVNYWVEDGTLKMSEKPVFSAYGSTKKLDQHDRDESVSTVLLYDVESVTFSYQRESDSDEWLDTWNASDEDQLPACVRLDVKPSAAGGPDFYHEIAVMVGTFNQIAEVDNDFRGPHRVKKSASTDDEDEDNDQPNSPGATVDPDGDEDDGE